MANCFQVKVHFYFRSPLENFLFFLWGLTWGKLLATGPTVQIFRNLKFSCF
jgi:hypothetical protein